MFQENSIETCILSRVKQITSPGWMHETSARTWCTVKTQREWVERAVGGGIRMGNTCKPMAVSFQCMTKSTTNIKKFKKKKSESHSAEFNSLQPHGLQSPWNSPGQSAGVGSLSLLQVIFPTQGSNPGGFFTSWASREAQEYWSGQSIPSPGDLSNSGIEPGSRALQMDSLPTELSRILE